MKSALFVPIAQGEVASCRVSGNFKHGYLKVKVAGVYRSVRPDEHPDVEDERREVFALPSGHSYDLWTVPAWQAGDAVRIELYDASNQFIDGHDTIVIP